MPDKNNTNDSVKIRAINLMDKVHAREVAGKDIDENLLSQLRNFTLDILKKSYDHTKNTMVSPLSLLQALAMASNGAKGETLRQMEKLLGGDVVSIDELNAYLYSLVQDLADTEETKMRIANSIWFRDDENSFIPDQGFLQINADYYGAVAYKAAFDKQTVEDINMWVRENTDEMIEEIIDRIDMDDILFIINAIVFDGKWEKGYEDHSVITGDYHAHDKSVQEASFMISEEFSYLEDESVTGFLKPYLGGAYSFLGLLPKADEDEDVKKVLDELLESLDGDRLANLLENISPEKVTVLLPKFENAFSIQMRDLLIELGITDAFDPGAADLSGLGQSQGGNLYVGEVLHKTFISVDEEGTRAAAVTQLGVAKMSFMEIKEVRLDRPFLYAVIDNTSGLPVFIGTVLSLD